MSPGVMPGFAIDGGFGLALARAVSAAGLASSCGALLFQAWVMPAGLAEGLRRWLRVWCWGSMALAFAGAALWFLTQTNDIAGDISPGSMMEVATRTWFGHTILFRVLCLGLAASALGLHHPRLACGFAFVAALLQAGHSHAFAMNGVSAALLMSALHVLAACVWLGGLVPLLLVIRAAPPMLAQSAARRFSRLGLACVGTLLLTAAWQFRIFIGDLPGLIGTFYGWVAGLKMALFALLITLAARNRLRHTPALAGEARARHALSQNILAEAGLGLAILLAAAVLSQLPPAMHVQKSWPLPWMLSFAAVREDADYAWEAGYAALASASGLALLALAFVRPRRLSAGLGMPAGVMLIALSVPHLSPLLVPAAPTAFFRSPTGFAAASITAGDRLYAAHCTGCHGISGRGDGPAAHGLRIPPADLTASHLWMHPDGELFWWIGHGIEDPEGGLAMPGFASLSDDDIWALIDAIRARNAGLRLTHAGDWARRLKAPDFPVTCADPAIHMLSDLRGHILRIVFGDTPPLASSVVTVHVGPAATPGPGFCASDDPESPGAYALAAGRPASASMQGSEFLVDAAGWLRQFQAPPGWRDPGAIAAAVRAIDQHPLPAESDAPMSMDMKM